MGQGEWLAPLVQGIQTARTRQVRLVAEEVEVPHRVRRWVPEQVPPVATALGFGIRPRVRLDASPPSRTWGVPPRKTSAKNQLEVGDDVGPNGRGVVLQSLPNPTPSLCSLHAVERYPGPP